MSTAPPVANRQSCATATSILVLNGETAMSGSTSVSGSQLPWAATVCRPIWPTCKTAGGPDGAASAGAAMPRPASAKVAPETMSTRSGCCTVPPSCLQSQPGLQAPAGQLTWFSPSVSQQGQRPLGTLDRYRDRVNGAGGVCVFSLPSPDRFVSYGRGGGSRLERGGGSRLGRGGGDEDRVRAGADR